MEKEVYPKKDHYNIDDLLEIMKILRGENGCPWDMEQDHHSIRKDLLEESYEVAEAIDLENADLLKEELGDLLLQVVFHAEIEREKDSFDFDAVCDGICKKLIYRHPHVFGNIHLNSSAEVLKSWDSLKSKAKGQETAGQRLDDISKALPPMTRGEKVCKRAANAGLKGMTAEIAAENIRKAAEQLEISVKSENNVEIGENLGKLLFASCNLSNLLKKDSDECLTTSINRFIMQFKAIEKDALEKDMTLDEIPEDQVIGLFDTGK
ncbi:MAG: nucleoside triphosphate pyrophosphohydrolase [Ruminococcaceae bacterium]|nr:nucleoside triphosphate pyrophosphohydrolase [Oscillospiraceae bacterium]